MDYQVFFIKLGSCLHIAENMFKMIFWKKYAECMVGTENIITVNGSLLLYMCMVMTSSFFILFHINGRWFVHMVNELIF